MIEYKRGYWGTGFVWSLAGSVLPKSLCWAFPNAVFAGSLHLAIHNYALFPSFVLSTDRGMTIGMSGYTMVLGFLLVFRTREAYSRWWESITLLQTTRGEWFGAYSNLLAFCNRDPAHKRAVETFQHTLVRLMSLLYGSALDQVCTVAKSTFEILDLTGFDEEHLEFLAQQEDKLDIVLQWLQQLIVIASKQNVLDIAPPILSRVFQELSRGKVNITNARKLSEFPFPFPYAQLLVFGLLIQWFVTPLLMCILCEDFWWASITSFMSSWFMWSINYVGEEIEEPYGDDSNDLPLEAIQKSYNSSLVILLMQKAQSTPKFTFSASCRTLRVSAFGSAGLGTFVMPGTSSADKNHDRVLKDVQGSRSRVSITSALQKGMTQGFMTKRERKHFKARGFTASLESDKVCNLVNADMTSDPTCDNESPLIMVARSSAESCLVDADGGTCSSLCASVALEKLENPSPCKDEVHKSTFDKNIPVGLTPVASEILQTPRKEFEDTQALGQDFEDSHPETGVLHLIQAVPKHDIPSAHMTPSPDGFLNSRHDIDLSMSSSKGDKPLRRSCDL